MFTDTAKTTFQDTLRQQDCKLFDRWLTPELVLQAATQAGIAVGRGPLHLGNLVWLALAAALRPALSFVQVLQLVLRLLRDAQGFSDSPLAGQQRRAQQRAGKHHRHRHDPHGQGSLTVSEEAFAQARHKVPWAFWIALSVLLAENFQRQHDDRVRFKGFRLLALDGTCLTLQRWAKLAAYFGTASNGRGRCIPQARLLMLQLPLVRMPYKYDLTPLAQSEVTVAKRLLAGLAAKDLVLMDRGFCSYGLFWQIQQQGAFFATRLKARLRLRTVEELSSQERLVEWQPSDWRKQWRQQGLPSTIRLRVINYQIQGFRPSAILTNVLEPQAVSAAEWIRLAEVDEAGRVLHQAGLYHRRWEIETTFAELKVTQGMEGQLRSRSPAGIQFEVAGHILLYQQVRWLMVEAAQRAGGVDPLRLSYSEALRELGEMRQTLLHSSVRRARRVLLPRLLQRLAAQQVPLRPGRHYPRPQDTKPKKKGKGRQQPASVVGGSEAQPAAPGGPKDPVPLSPNQEPQTVPQQVHNMVA